MKFYERLQKETETERNYFLTAPIIEDVFLGNFTIETYIAFLHQAFHHVKQTIPLLMQAGARVANHPDGLQKVIAEYIEEEIGHEQWILNDIRACGFDRSEFETSEPSYETEMMVSYLFDVATRKNPVGIFGMVQVLEGTSSTLAPEVAKLIKSKLSLPEHAMTYLVSHGELDQDHIQFFENTMNSITSKQDQDDIIHAANNVYHLYGDVYRSIQRVASEINQRQAA